MRENVESFMNNFAVVIEMFLKKKKFKRRNDKEKTFWFQKILKIYDKFEASWLNAF